MADTFNWITTVIITANAKTTAEQDALIVQLLLDLAAMKDAGLINYADYSVAQSFVRTEGKVG